MYKWINKQFCLSVGVTPGRNPIDYPCMFQIATLELHYRLICDNTLRHTPDYYWKLIKGK